MSFRNCLTPAFWAVADGADVTAITDAACIDATVCFFSSVLAASLASATAFACATFSTAALDTPEPAAVFGIGSFRVGGGMLWSMV